MVNDYASGDTDGAWLATVGHDAIGPMGQPDTLGRPVTQIGGNPIAPPVGVKVYMPITIDNLVFHRHS